MINLFEFLYFITDSLNRDIIHNKEQRRCVIVSPEENQLIIAGPGSGKTTVLVLKVLKFIFVDDISPRSILITTFTKKAAKEIRSRILGWSDQLRIAINNHPSILQPIKDLINRINFNEVITGTLDSIAEDFLTTYRAPGISAPTIIQEFLSNIIMKRCLRENNILGDPDFEDYIRYLQRRTTGYVRVKDKCSLLRQINERIFHDQINVRNYIRSIFLTHPGIIRACEGIHSYNRYLNENLLYDFVKLERVFLNTLQNPVNNPNLRTRLQEIKIVLVDEYQDTNLLQEEIYFELTEYALINNGSLSVVGDDDQSLYRFRGATVDLFVNFPRRFRTRFGLGLDIRNLRNNYRSTNNIIDLFNQYINLDPIYTGTPTNQGARIANKPEVQFQRTGVVIDYPVLGIIRNNLDDLALAIREFIEEILQGGYNINQNYRIELDPQNGSINDLVLLCDSPNDRNSSGNPRLPLLIRQELDNINIRVFNPRGTNIQEIREIQILCGLLLECLDPHRAIQNANAHSLRNNSQVFDNWRAEANHYIALNPTPHTPITLGQFVDHWRNRIPYPTTRSIWIRQTALNYLIYKLLYWLPFFYETVEGIVYLNAITDTISQFSSIATYNAEVETNQGGRTRGERFSINEFLWNILVPIAEGLLEIDEELYETLPPGNFNILSIHQSKGLEFPLVFVDVGSDFRTNNFLQRKRRYPDDQRILDENVIIERELRTYSLNPVQRNDIDRAFDEIIRKFFVSYSRPKDILVLVGISTAINGRKNIGTSWIPNVASGWIRPNNNPITIALWRWGQNFRNLNNIVFI